MITILAVIYATSMVWLSVIFVILRAVEVLIKEDCAYWWILVLIVLWPFTVTMIVIDYLRTDWNEVERREQKEADDADIHQSQES
jgi:hypothetical protein